MAALAARWVSRHALSHRRRIIGVHAILGRELLSQLGTLIGRHLGKVLLKDLLSAATSAPAYEIRSTST